MGNDKVLSMLGLACKAGRLVGGEFSVEQSVRGGKAFMVVIAGDVSESLGQATGKAYRASLAILDEGFKKAIMKLVDSAK